MRMFPAIRAEMIRYFKILLQYSQHYNQLFHQI